jgi:hypothetical protein
MSLPVILNVLFCHPELLFLRPFASLLVILSEASPRAQSKDLREAIFVLIDLPAEDVRRNSFPINLPTLGMTDRLMTMPR